MPKYNVKMAIEDNKENSDPAKLEEFIRTTFIEVKVLNISIEEVK